METKNQSIVKRMTKVYETAKRIGRKYVAPLAMGLALSYGGGCDKSKKSQLPIRADVAEQIVESQTQQYEQSREEFRGLQAKTENAFNEAIADRNFTLEEQANVRSLTGKSKEAFDHVKGYAERYNLDSNGLKFGLESLEVTPYSHDSFEKMGLDIAVESDCLEHVVGVDPNENIKSVIMTLAPLVLLSMAGLYGYSCKLHKQKRGNKRK